jgi:hypothetical protein
MLVFRGTSACHPQLFAQHAAQSLFQFRRFAYHVLTQGFVD